MLCLHVRAPFAAFRTFAAGSFRPSAPFITYSAAYGLFMNIAGREMRAPDDGKSAMTRIATGLPVVELALGLVGAPPTRHGVFQQLHNYPVGSSGKEHAKFTYGNKHNITPARREFLRGLNALIAVRGDEALETDIRAGLDGERPRYGLPFLGDNSFLPDRIEIAPGAAEALWLEPAEGRVLDDEEGEAMRLTLTIDRADMARTRSGLFAPARRPRALEDVEAASWVELGYA
ncbi:MAG: CRISPR-associated protein Cas5 [Gammaproteobacteria bacterium]